MDSSGQGHARPSSVGSHGETWQAGEPVGTGMDENKTVELSDGTDMLNSRDSARSGYRKVAYSTDGGRTYGEVTIDRELPDPTNNASIVRAYPDAPEGSDEAEVLLFSHASSQSSRSNGTVRLSDDDGETWSHARTFAAGSMSYSTLATLPDGDVGLLYEPGNGIRFASFDLDWLLAAPDVSPGAIEVTGGPLVDPQETYDVGDTLRFTYTVQNLSPDTTTVVPTGNLDNLDPAEAAQNCRWCGLGGDASYTCTYARHVVTQDDVDAGGFTPVTTWTSTSGDHVTVVEHEGERVALGSA